MISGSSPLSNGSLNNNAGGELDYMEKMRGDEPDEADKTASKRSSKAMNSGNHAGPRDASRKGRATSSNNKDELITKMESDNKKLKVDLQLSRNKENDLRDQIVSYMTSKYSSHTLEAT